MTICLVLATLTRQDDEERGREGDMPFDPMVREGLPEKVQKDLRKSSCGYTGRGFQAEATGAKVLRQGLP